MLLTFLLVGRRLPGLRQDAGAEDGHQGELSHLLSVRWNMEENRGQNEGDETGAGPGCAEPENLLTCQGHVPPVIRQRHCGEVESVPEDETNGSEPQ